MVDADLPPEWQQGADGYWHRDAARVVLLDEHDRVLLLCGHTPDQPGQWWFTVGGGIDAGETARQCAVRELHEETGLRLNPGGLVGPVFVRSARFPFFGRPVHQDEQFFLARVDRPRPVHAAALTELEQRFVDGMRWWTLTELAATAETIYPPELADELARLLDGWDGTVHDLGLQEEHQ